VVRQQRGSVKIIRSLIVAVAVLAPVSAAVAQDAFDAKAAAHVRNEYLTDLDTLHSKIMALANAIPADKYSWRPVAGVRSVSEALMHIASEWYFFVPKSLGGKEPADFGTPREKMQALEKIATKTEVIDQLNKSWTHGRAQVAGADPSTLTGKIKPWNATVDAAGFAMSGDLHEHLGQLIAYARSIGVKPPWSK
jgi:uncharacterized damage-inducible protein DinB